MLNSIQVKNVKYQQNQSHSSLHQQNQAQQIQGQTMNMTPNEINNPKDEYWDGLSPNADFYLGLKEGSNKMIITELLKLKGKYEELERNHSYIQWLFPNHYKSEFNHNSYPLTDGDVRKMKENDVFSNYKYFKVIRQRYLQGLNMFLDFLGLRFNKEGGQIEIIDEKGEKRLSKALYFNIHNRLRIRRLLASLLALNFTDEAQKLCDFLKKFPNLYTQLYKFYDKNGTNYKKEYIEGKGASS